VGDLALGARTMKDDGPGRVGVAGVEEGFGWIEMGCREGSRTQPGLMPLSDWLIRFRVALECSEHLVPC